jgi:hypothetical protein
MLDIFRTLAVASKDLDGGDAVREAIVFAAWRRVAGDLLAEHTVPIRLEDSRFVVAVSGEIWRKHLKDLSSQMLFKLNSAAGMSLVSFIEFCVDEAVVNESRVQADEGLAAASEMEAAAGQIADDELRATFLLAAGSCLIRKKQRTQ